ncbi:AAA family ATPase [Lonsdalea quercina]|uniref:AAA family ATPase n=1 Tax=Lonsdalea quercina TaxID=71657 RepID=UPI003976F684
MFIKSLKIENFKGYHGADNNLEFNIPDGNTEGSGLNIFVGENNSGKSTVFEVMDFIKDGTKKKIEDLLSKSFPDNIPEHLSAEIIFTGNLSEVIAAHVQGNKVVSFNSHGLC